MRLTATILLAALAVHFFVDPSALAYVEGEPFWRTLTAHLVHWSTAHLLLDLCLFGLCGLWCERHAPGRQRVLLATASVWLAPLACALDTRIVAYAGLSGLFWVQAGLALHAAEPLHGRTRMRGLMAMVLLKIGIEVARGGPLGWSSEDAAFVSVPIAHLLGVVWGWCGSYGLSRLRPARRDGSPAPRAASAAPSASARRLASSTSKA